MTAPVDTFRGRFLPYCLIPAAAGRYIVVNRDYKPLGLTRSAGWVDYDSHPTTAGIKGLTASRIAAIAATGAAEEDGRIYLYNDGCVPTASAGSWAAYAKRLEALASLSLE